MREPQPVPVERARTQIQKLHPGCIVDLETARIAGLAVEVAELRATQGSLLTSAVESSDHSLQTATASCDVARIVRRHVDAHGEPLFSDARIWWLWRRIQLTMSLSGKPLGDEAISREIQRGIDERDAAIEETISRILAESPDIPGERVATARRILRGER
ncbi:hypothetical protein GCM10022288_11600 [Gryllotalpicola kribbensis]|uniref:DUF222 domain-containing protein n=1 Tax=Gryllotalpicola kribbensis TaxID=993084 RepID=A0ABP8ANY3_9MICO